jgi:hypothetical protein
MRKKEDSGGTSPAGVYAVKKMKSHGAMLANSAIPCFILSVRLGDCHHISCRRLAREPVILNHEDGSSAAMAVNGGRRLRRKQEMRENKRQKRRAQDGRRMEVWIRMVDSTLYLSSPTSGSSSGVALGAHTVHSAYPNTDKGT